MIVGFVLSFLFFTLLICYLLFDKMQHSATISEID